MIKDPPNKHRFFCNIKNEKEDESVQIYLGQSCGKQLQKEIDNAREEVLIVSPYIDAVKVDSLIRIYRKNVNVRLAFSYIKTEKNENRNDKRSEILQQLISQLQHTDEEKKAQKLKLQNRYQLIRNISIFVCLLASVVVAYYSITHKQWVGLLVIPALFGFYSLINAIIKNKKYKANRIPIYKYSYSKNIPFKCFYHGRDKFMHTKIYIIDRKVAYLGSMNFTNNGFTSNFETRVRITHQEQIDELHSFVTNIFEDEDSFPEVYPRKLVEDAEFYQPPY